MEADDEEGMADGSASQLPGSGGAAPASAAAAGSDDDEAASPAACARPAGGSRWAALDDEEEQAAAAAARRAKKQRAGGAAGGSGGLAVDDWRDLLRPGSGTAAGGSRPGSSAGPRSCMSRGSGSSVAKKRVRWPDQVGGGVAGWGGWLAGLEGRGWALRVAAPPTRTALAPAVQQCPLAPAAPLDPQHPALTAPPAGRRPGGGAGLSHWRRWRARQGRAGGRARPARWAGCMGGCTVVVASSPAVAAAAAGGGAACRHGKPLPTALPARVWLSAAAAAAFRYPSRRRPGPARAAGGRQRGRGAAPRRRLCSSSQGRAHQRSRPLPPPAAEPRRSLRAAALGVGCSGGVRRADACAANHPPPRQCGCVPACLALRPALAPSSVRRHPGCPG